MVEQYPDLKASEPFLKLQEELATTEDRIQRARRFYNANVRELNTRVEVFPSNLVAAMFGFAAAEFFEVEIVLGARGGGRVSARNLAPVQKGPGLDGEPPIR